MLDTWQLDKSQLYRQDCWPVESSHGNSDPCQKTITGPRPRQSFKTKTKTETLGIKTKTKTKTLVFKTKTETFKIQS